MRTRPGDERIALKHGAGGRAMRALIEEVFVGPLGGDRQEGIGLAALDDGAALPFGDGFLVLTTDSHVVKPAFFPGGDIGRLAVAGTVNDLAVMGATEPLALSCALMVEEGYSRSDLERVRDSLVATCREAGVEIVTGDTKVLGRGELDGIALNTTGIGFTRRPIRDRGLSAGNRILVTGTMGDHGMAVLSVRHDLDLGGELRSDVAPLNDLLRRVLALDGAVVTALKDATRGGLASALHEMAGKSGVGIVLEESAVPLRDEVRAAGEMLGIDPLHVANEGKAVIGVRADAAERVLEVLRSHPLGREAAVVGTCVDERPGSIVLDTGFGRRLLTEIEGDPLPRIC